MTSADPESDPDPRTCAESALTCRQCGQPDARPVGDEILCAACLHERGSCGAVRDEEG
ncbi:hypothetical protein [Oleiharenicola lentus]|uniref:hypothetical protein n=1 Tax=Oleiharenicola lentus TaxID=2508720 RepID=UPI0013E9253A|nr:hypothetical protein [Oleiharenicola lentus]